MLFFMFLFKQKTAYEMRISDWSSDVCSSDLAVALRIVCARAGGRRLVAVVGVDGKTRPAIGRRSEIENVRVTGGARLLAACLTDCAQQATLRAAALQIGRAPCRERVCQYV